MTDRYWVEVVRAADTKLQASGDFFDASDEHIYGGFLYRP